MTHRKTRLLLVAEATAGGTRRHLFDLVAGLDRDRYEIAVLCSSLRDPDFQNDVAQFKARGIAVHDVPMVRSIRHPIYDLTALRAMRALLQDAPFDLVHTHSAKAGFLGRLAVRLGARRRTRVLHTAHVFPFQMRVAAPVRLGYWLLEKMAARWTDRFLCVCHAEKRAAVHWRLARPDRFTVIHNGLSIDPRLALAPAARAAQRRRLGYGPDDFVVGNLGRLAPQKGLVHLLEAVHQWTARPASLRLLLVGDDGQERERIRMLARRWGLDSILRILPARDNPAELYSVFDLFVMPSLWEGLPYGLLEAMAARLAIVASHVGGIPEAIRHQENGWLVPPAQPARLAEALAHLARNPALCRQLGAKAAETAATQFRIDTMIAQIQTAYDRLAP